MKDDKKLLNEFMDWLDPNWHNGFNPRLMYCAVPHTSGDWKTSRYQLVDLFLAARTKERPGK